MPTIRHLALVRDTSRVDSADLTRTAAALQRQVLEDFQPVWRRGATVDAFLKLEDVPVDYWPIIVRDDIPYDAQGIHLDNEYGPYSLLLWDEGWSLTASHECLEMLADPYGNRTRAGASPKSGQGEVRFLVEVCDPSEAESFAYERNGVAVSDFYFPSYFAAQTKSGEQYSFTRAIRRPRQVLRGGYLSWKVSTGEWWQQTWFGTSAKFINLGAKPRDLPPRRFTDGTTTVPKKFMAARRRRALTGAARENGSAAKAKALRANVREIAFGT